MHQVLLQLDSLVEELAVTAASRQSLPQEKYEHWHRQRDYYTSLLGIFNTGQCHNGQGEYNGLKTIVSILSPLIDFLCF
jgi:hypothetical protein